MTLPVLDPWEAALLAGGGLVAGVINTLAGGGSMLTVPLLVLVGLPGTLANGSNRIGVGVMNAVATWRFRAEGVSGIRLALPLLAPVAAGALLGALAISRVEDATFERIFGVIMLLVIAPILRPPGRGKGPGAGEAAPRPSSGKPAPLGRPLVLASFFAIGVYGGAVQAGVGFLLIFALSRAGFDLVQANSVKVTINVILSAMSAGVFILAGQVVWPAALVLAGGFAGGGFLGARIAVRGGERVIRPVLGLALIALAGRMLGFY